MSNIDVENSNLKQLADRLVDDIRRRGLRPGDRYLTASEAGRKFKASPISVHRAMQLLADRDYLIRQRGSGTFVGPQLTVTGEKACRLRVVHVVMSMDYQRTATVPAEVLVDRLGVSVPEAVVQVHYVTLSDAMRHLDRIVEGIGESDKTREGIILIRSTRQMQMYVEQSGLPAVVFGGVYRGVSRLPWLDVDQAVIGEMMARHVLGGKPRRIAMLMRDDWRHGDNLMVEGVIRVLGDAGYSAGAITILSVPPDPHHIEEELHAVLSDDPSISGIICRTHLYAQAATRALETAGDRRDGQVRVVAGGGRKPASIRYAYVAPEVDEQAQVELIGRMLAERANDGDGEPQSRMIPVRLVGGS